MSGITLETAQKHLDGWLEAEMAVMAGQSYRIGSRELSRADLSEIRKAIKYWEGKIAELKNLAAHGSRGRTYRIVPRDL